MYDGHDEGDIHMKVRELRKLLSHYDQDMEVMTGKIDNTEDIAYPLYVKMAQDCIYSTDVVESDDWHGFWQDKAVWEDNTCECEREKNPKKSKNILVFDLDSIVDVE